MNREVHVRFSEGLGLQYAGLLNTAIPALPEASEINGCLVGIDAMGCQKEVAGAIRRRGTDYMLAVKNNQHSLRAAIEDAFADAPVLGLVHSARTSGRAVVHIEDDLANERNVSGPMVLANLRDVSAEDDVQAPVQLVLVGPVQAHSGEERFMIKFGRADVVPGFDAIDSQRDDVAEAPTFGPDGRIDLPGVGDHLHKLQHQDTACPKVRLKERRKMAGWDDDEGMRLLGITTP